MLGELAWWVTIVIAVREIGVTLLRFWVIRHGVIPASRGGKAKTLVQVVAIGLYLLPLPAAFDLVGWALMGLARGAHRRHRRGLRGPRADGCVRQVGQRPTGPERR